MNMLFLVHDENGQITQSNKHYSPEGYDKLLTKFGYKFVAVESNHILMPDQHYIRSGEVLSREPMRITADRKSMRVGKGVTFSGLPRSCRMTVSVGPHIIESAAVTDGEAYFESPVPGLFTLRFEAFPYIPWTRQIECTA